MPPDAVTLKERRNKGVGDRNVSYKSAQEMVILKICPRQGLNLDPWLGPQAGVLSIELPLLDIISLHIEPAIQNI